MYGYWTLSDIYEEMNTGTATAYREGNYGLLLKGDPNIPASFDVAKPAFNAFRLLHMMTDTIVPVSGGIASATDNGVGAVATLASDGNSIQILVYNHINSFDIATWEAKSQESTLVSLAVSNLPFTPTRVRHYRRRPHALELAHDVGRHGQAADAERRPVEHAARRVRALLLRGPGQRRYVVRDVSAEHLQRVSDRTVAVVRQKKRRFWTAAVLATLLAALPARAQVADAGAPAMPSRRRRADAAAPADAGAPAPVTKAPNRRPSRRTRSRR